MGKTGSKPTDELIILAQRGNGLAFTALWDRHIEQLRSYIKARFKNIDDYAADDICSRSFEKAFRQIMSYDQYKSRFFDMALHYRQEHRLGHSGARAESSSKEPNRLS